MKKLYALIFSLCFCNILFSQAPVVTGFSPAYGPPGTNVVITGTGFSTSGGGFNNVWIGNMPCYIVSGTATELVVKIPKFAGWGPFQVTNRSSSLSCITTRKFLVNFSTNPEIGYNYDQLSFDPPIQFTKSATSGSSKTDKYVIMDIANQGKADVALFSSTKDLMLFRSSAISGSITPATFYSTTTAAGTVSDNYGTTSAADFDMDGDIDLISGVPGYTGSFFCRNLGNGNIIQAVGMAGSSAFTPRPIDYNNDGKIDLIGGYVNSLEVWRNATTAGNFSSAYSSSGRAITGSPILNLLKTGDLDNDGKVDIVSAANNNANIFIFKNNTTTATANFINQTPLVNSGTQCEDLHLVDLDGDGKEDIVTVTGTASTVSVFMNNSNTGTISFLARANYDAGFDMGASIAVGDMNNDGKPDLVIGKFSGYVFYLENKSTGPGNIGFATPVVIYYGTEYIKSLNLHDIDGDDCLDIIGIVNGTGNLIAIRNKIRVRAKYYSRNNATDLHLLSSWTDKSDGTTGIAPINFGIGKTFYLANRTSYDLKANMTIGGELWLTNAPFKLNNFNLTAALISNPWANGYIQTNGTGKLKMLLQRDVTTVLPVGNASYNPATITNRNTTADTFSILVKNEVYENGVDGTTITYNRIKRTWDLSKFNPNTGNGVDLNFGWTLGGSEISGSFDPRIYHFNNDKWEKLFAPGKVTVGQGYVEFRNYTGTFSPFAIVDNASALPVTWLSFTATKRNNQIVLNWITATEINTKDFIVQHSRDGINWQNLATLGGAGNSQTPISYAYAHSLPYSGANLYRILQRDLDNHQSYSKILNVLWGKTGASVQVYPTPVNNGTLNIQLPEASEITLIAVDGKPVFKKNLPAGVNSIQVGYLPKGVYGLKVNNEIFKVVIQ